ncbi:related to RAD2 - structure-specific nuclease of the nucleotide excision repairosome [Melanopsichium pennsylvanicum]|uniref:Related to RAD2 - structure-specific nuclease of the nucleotide excision repairosome n=2 Tax=Melanopsichium pennsylvanicum TaxID=63383 RepID=A0AAJ4XP14_9BASI|nr:related to RAD2-structure-specific nuclease of the nucleotide excision repairosome [Melanopsichium pennsylvanicum 4]SNX85855.1 related to RAD2 - structure-specific nuclease of the nucleotide excision repairosome [Melanopsichium pennsylvanicum]
MGVQGLWQLLQPVARPIKIETLEGKRLAIDSSLWLYHFQMAMRDKEGRTLSNAHILGFLWRILKLLFHGVRPVFVFDGGAPVMKRKTLSARKSRKQGAKESHARTAEKLLAAQMRQAAIKHVADGQVRSSSSSAQQATTSKDATGLGENTVYYDDLQAGRPTALPSTDLQSTEPDNSARPSRESSSSPTKPGARKVDWHKDPYALPAMDKDLNQVSATNGKKGRKKDYRFATEDELRAVMNTIAPEDLDTTSELFRSLPTELQYELVGDLRAQSRMTSYKRLQSMLATAPTPIDFSRAQIAGLKTRNDLTQKVLTVTDEIGKANIKVPIRVAGERNKEYVLVRNPGAEGGFVLGVRDAGTSQEKAIDVDYEPEEINITDDEAEHTDSEPEMDMDEVEIPVVEASPSRSMSRTADPELYKLQKETDPYMRKEKALELLQARAKHHAKQKRREAGMLDDDEDDLIRALQPRHNRGERPLFIRNQKHTAGRPDSPSQQSDWIDVDVESDEEDFQVVQDIDQELEGDEAEDLARAIAQSQAAGSSSRAPLTKHSGPLRGIKLAHRSGEPISLHDTMSHRQRDPQTLASNGLLDRSPSAPESADTIAGGDPEMDEDDFEDVQLEAPPMLQEIESAALQDPTCINDTPVGRPDRKQELALLFGRDNKHNGDAAKPPPRKSLAGSLRAARRSTSSSNLHDKPTPIAQPEASPGKSEQMTAPRKYQVTETQPRPAETSRMGPPLRSASQQRLELADLPPKSSTPGAPAQEELPPTPEEVNRQIAIDIDADGSGGDDDEFEVVRSSTKFSDEQRNMQTAISTPIAAPAIPPTEPPKPATPTALPHTERNEVSTEVEPVVAAADLATAAQAPWEPDEPGMALSLCAPEGGASAAQGLGVTERGASPDPAALDNVPSAVAEPISSLPPMQVTRPSPPPEAPQSRQKTPMEWSPTPSPSPEPVVIGADGFPLPTAEELDALSDSSDDNLHDDQNEFVAFLSATKGRSLLDVQREVESEVNALRAEFANSRRSEEDITKQMAQEIQMMLRLFGLPYITAPMEAEAQCAELVSRRLVDGIITDDSDVFLFGGTRIYKNMFNNNKIVECFLLSDMQRELGLDREKLVRLAYYLGSDYTEGLAGVGPVVAMELLALFPGEDGLLKFRDWWQIVQMGKDTEEHTRGKTMRRIKRNLRNKVHLESSWPEPAVLDAYYSPAVDESDEPFAWGLPDLDSVRTFLGEYLHWPVSKTDQYLLPIIERQNARNRARGNQTTLDRNGFFDTSAGTGIYAGRKKVSYGSNRLQEVINGFRSANKAKTTNAQRKREGKNDNSSSSGSEDQVQVVSARMITPMVSEEMLGKEMGKKRPVVRRDEGQAEVMNVEARRAELDAAIEALEGTDPSAKHGQNVVGKRKKSVNTRKSRTKKVSTLAENEQNLSSSASSLSSSEDDLASRRETKASRTCTGAANNSAIHCRGRGRNGRAATKATSKSRGTARRGGRGRGTRANLDAARNMSLDDVHTLPPSRSASVDAATLRARGSRRSSSSTASSARSTTPAR